MVCWGFGGKSSFSSERRSLLVHALQNHLSIAYLFSAEIQLALSFVALRIGVKNEGLASERNAATGKKKKSNPEFTAKRVGSLQACGWPSLAACRRRELAEALSSLLHPFFCRYA